MDTWGVGGINLRGNNSSSSFGVKTLYTYNDMNYSQYISSSDWKAKRLEVLSKKWNQCERCGSKNKIHIHHGSYTKLGNEPLKHLFVLCEKCHDLFHSKYKMWKSMLNKTMNFIHGKWWRSKNKANRISDEVPLAIAAIHKWIWFWESWIVSIKAWQKAKRFLRKSSQ